MLGWSVSPFYPGSLVSTLLGRWEFTPLFSFSTFIIATWWSRKLPVQPGFVLQCTWPSFSVTVVSKLLCTADPTHFSSLDDLKKADTDFDVRDWLLNFWLLFLWRNTCRDQLKEEGRVYSTSRFEAVVSAWWCRSHGSRNVRGVMSAGYIASTIRKQARRGMWMPRPLAPFYSVEAPSLWDGAAHS